MTSAAGSTLLSIVVIGRDEGEHLTRCLESVQKIDFPFGEKEIIYVDSGSKDDSLQRAAAFPVQILPLKNAHPSAASARNIGWRTSRGAFILFVDGDTILDPEFGKIALSKFAIPIIAVVNGNVTELFPRRSVYHRVLDVDWNPQPGFVDSCGGIAIMRRAVLEEVGGFDETLFAGEEPELCWRIRNRGYKILHMDIPMVLHDLDMYAFSQYWKRCQRTGYAYAQIEARYRKEEDPLWKKEARYNLLKGGGLLLIGFLSICLSFYEHSFIPLLTLPILLSMLAFRTAWRVRKSTDGWATAFLYGFHAHFQHIPMFVGQLLRRFRAAS
jgi:glycosyltransferase involved in cell wall biosynthesis